MKKYLICFLVLPIFIVLTLAVFAESEIDYPQRTITVIIPYAAGGGSDTDGRLAISKLEKVLGVPMVVKNVTGAGGTIGVRELTQSDPDGYTMGFYNAADMMIRQGYQDDLGFTTDDCIPLFGFADTPYGIITNDEQINTPKKFVEFAKENPGVITISTVGDAHLTNVLELQRSTGIDLTIVPVSSGAEGLNLVMGGHIKAAVVAPQFAISAEEQGGSVIGVFSEERIDTLPHIPTFNESGIPLDFVVSSLRLIQVPAGTPEEIIDILVEASIEIAEGPEGEDLKEKITNIGGLYNYRSGKELREYVKMLSEKIVPFVEENKDLYLE